MLEFWKESEPRILIRSHLFREKSWGCPRAGMEGIIEADQTVSTAPFGEEEAGGSQGRSEVGRYRGCSTPEVRDEGDSTGSSLCPREKG